MSLLDDILGKTTKLHSSVRNTRVGDDANEVATPYMMSKSASAPSSSVECKMPECTPPNTAAIFDIDMRHGDRVCVRCGTVQNSRSIESQEEEHRTFADDDKGESKKRAENNDGKQGGPSLALALALARTQALTPPLILTQVDAQTLALARGHALRPTLALANTLALAQAQALTPPPTRRQNRRRLAEDGERPRQRGDRQGGQEARRVEAQGDGSCDQDEAHLLGQGLCLQLLHHVQ